MLAGRPTLPTRDTAGGPEFVPRRTSRSRWQRLSGGASGWPGSSPSHSWVPTMTRGTGRWPPRGDCSMGGQSWRATSQGHWWRGPETAGMTPQESAPGLCAAPNPQHPRRPQAWPLPAAWPRLPRGSPTTGRWFSGSRALQGLPIFVHTVPSAARPFPLCT